MHTRASNSELDPIDDEPMWAADRVVASTPCSAITILKTANEFAIKDTENEAVRLMMFPLSLTGEAKTWLNELNEGTIEINAPKQISKGNIIKIFYHGLSEITQEVLNVTAGCIFFYKTPNHAYQLLEDKVLLKLDWAKNQKTQTSLKKTVAFTDEGQRIETYTMYSDQLNTAYLSSDTCMTRSSTKELLSPFENTEQKFRLRKRLFDIPSLVESNSMGFDHIFDIEEQSKEEVRETMTETMEQYMRKTRGDYGSGVTRPTINQDTHFELKVQFLKELRDNTFSGSEHEDANKHIEKVLDIVYVFHILKVTQDQIMLRAFPVSLTGAASSWLRNQPSGSITTWEVLKTKFLNKYCPPARTAKKINNLQQEPDESPFRAWEIFKELLMKCPQHYLTDMQEAIQEMVEYSQKWHNGTSSRTKSTKTSDGLAAIQAQLNNLRQEIKKVNEKVYAAQVECELCKGPHYMKDWPQKEKGKTLEEAYYTQFGAPYQPGG
ncbi:ribonuclease H-like domain-containing protein [Tanacetum coccineum]